MIPKLVSYLSASGFPYLSNVTLKLNLKLNGVNYIMDLPLKKVLTMFLGTAVTYPPPESAVILSIAQQLSDPLMNMPFDT